MLFKKTKSIEIKGETNWKDATKAGVQILVDNNDATMGLYDAILESTKQMGAYYVLEKGIALLHAPVGEYCLEAAASLVYLKDNIQFNDEDKYARILIVLSAPNSTTHMEYIKEFGEIFTNEELKGKLLSTEKLEEFLHLYNEYMKKGGN